MGRSKNNARLDQILRTIQQNPDHRASWIARQMECDNTIILRALTQLEERGDLLQEGDRGRLRWFGNRK